MTGHQEGTIDPLATIKQTIGGLQAAFPDLTSMEDDLIAVGDKVVTRRTLRGIHKGEFMGVVATGREVVFSGVWLAQLSNGKIKEQSFPGISLAVIGQPIQMEVN